MIIQTAPAGQPRLAIMMYEHTALSHQFARAFGNAQFQPSDPNDLMFHVVLHHDAGWAEFDRNPATDPKTRLPYNLVDTPPEHITVTSRQSPDYNAAASSVLRPDLEHAQLGALQWALWPLEHGADRQDPAAGPAARPAHARRRARPAEAAQGRACDGSRHRAVARREADFSELQAASVLRHARALFQPHSPKRAHRGQVRARPAQCRRGRDHHGAPARAGSVRAVALSVRRSIGAVRLSRDA